MHSYKYIRAAFSALLFLGKYKLLHDLVRGFSPIWKLFLLSILSSVYLYVYSVLTFYSMYFFLWFFFFNFWGGTITIKKIIFTFHFRIFLKRKEMKLTFGTLLTILWAFSSIRAKAVGEYLKMLKSESFKYVWNFKKC